LIGCYNPPLAGERKRKRHELLAAAERKARRKRTE